MADFSFLANGVQGPEIANPLTLALQGMSLADLSNKINLSQLQQQVVNLDLEKTRQSAAAVPEMMSRLANGEQAGQIFGDPNFAGKYPLAVQPLLQAQRTLEQTQADIAAKTAVAAKDNAEAKAKALQDIGRIAYGETQNPNQLSLSKVKSAAEFYGVQLPSFSGDPADRSAVTGYLSALGSVAMNPEQAAQVWAIHEKTPGEIRLNDARTSEASAAANLSSVNAGLRPKEVQAKLTEANAAASNAARGWADAAAPSFVSNPVTGGGSWITRGISPSGPTAPAVTPALDNQGNPVQTGPSLTDTTNAKAIEPRVQSVQNDLQMAQRMRQILPALKARLQAGDNGPLANSPQGRMLLQTMSEYGVLPQSQIDKVANMSASDALSMELAGPLVHALGSGRGGLGLTQMVTAKKPGPGQSLPASLAMIDALDQDMQGVQSYGKAFLDYRQKNPTDVSMTGFDFTPAVVPVNMSSQSPTAPKASSLPDVGRIVPTNDARGRFAIADPKGGVHYFPSEGAAFEFKQAAGL